MLPVNKLISWYVPGMPLRYVDPNRNRGRMYRAEVRLGRSRVGQFLARRVAPRIDPWLYRATGGRYPASLPVVTSAPLMTTGAQTGRPREVQVAYFHDGPDPILVASNYGGPKHPNWYYNLKAQPECQLGDERPFSDRGHRSRRVCATVRTRRASLRGVQRLPRQDGGDWSSDSPISAQAALSAIH